MFVVSTANTVWTVTALRLSTIPLSWTFLPWDLLRNPFRTTTKSAKGKIHPPLPFLLILTTVPCTNSIVKSLTGASRVIVFHHLIRGRPADEALLANKSNRIPAYRAHVDQSAASAHVRLARHSPADVDKKTPFQVINLWRPLVGPVQDAPLAMVDYTTVNPSDLFPAQLSWPDPEETLLARYNPAAEWVFLEEQTSDEVVLIKCFDSRAENEGKDGIAPYGVHGAFVHPDWKGPVHRQSVEIRALALFD